MQSKPTEILELERIYNIKIDELFGGNPMQMSDRNTYQLNQRGAIIGLNLSKNLIYEIAGLEELVELRFLFLNYNQITKIEGLENLSKLVILNLDGNRISKIEGLDNLKKLNQLSIANNSIEKIEGLDNLKKLRTLYLDGNSISKIEGVNNLPILRTLSLQNNHIADIEKLASLKKIYNLNLSNNNILTGYHMLCDLANLKYLSIEKNPFIKNISNFILHENENHLYALRSKLKLTGKKVVTLPAKVLLLGNHSSGKSTFADYFLKQNDESRTIKSTETTHILNILNLYKSGKNDGLPIAKIYDFGGQDYYHGIYKAFLTGDSINVVFWHKEINCNQIRIDSKKLHTQDFNREYWIYQLIHYYQKEIVTENSDLHEFFLVQTHADMGDKKEIIFANNERPYYIENEFFIGLDNDYMSKKIGQLNYALLEASIMNEIQRKQRTVEVSQAYMEFLEYVNNYSEHTGVSVKTLKRKFPELTLTDKEFQEELIQLCRHGLVLYYPHNDALKDVVWLNPGKTVEKIHEILSRKFISSPSKGVISKKVFDGYIKSDVIVELLKENKVIYLDNTDEKRPKYIIPGFLPLAKNRIDEFFLLSDFEEANYILKFENFIPFGLINQLVCHYGKNPEAKLFWRDRLLFTTKDRQARVLLSLDFKRQEISVYIKPKNRLLQVKSIEREILDDIIKIYWDEDKSLSLKQTLDGTNDDNLLFPKEIKRKPIIDLFISTDGVFFIKLNDIDLCEDPNELIGYPLTEDGVIDLARGKRIAINSYIHLSTNSKLHKMKNIFISYSSKDYEYLEELQIHLSPLKTLRVIETWDCTKLRTGDWNEQIQEKLKNADIIIFMLSPYFLASEYILNKELLPVLQDFRENKSKKMFFVVVRNFAYNALSAIAKVTDGITGLTEDNVLAELPKHQSIPYQVEDTENGKIRKLTPVNQWKYKEEAYVKIIEQLIQEIS